jgi:hypothetical protein
MNSIAPNRGPVSRRPDPARSAWDVVNKLLEALLDCLQVRVAGDLHANVRMAELGVFDRAADYLEPHQRGSERDADVLFELLRERDVKSLRAVVDRVELSLVPFERQRHDRAVIAVCMRSQANAFVRAEASAPPWEPHGAAPLGWPVSHGTQGAVVPASASKVLGSTE